MEDWFNRENNGISFLDYARNYTFAIISGVGAVSCFAYAFAKDEPSFMGFGVGALFMASLRGINGYINLKKIEKLFEENKELKRRLELRVS